MPPRFKLPHISFPVRDVVKHSPGMVPTVAPMVLHEDPKDEKKRKKVAEISPVKFTPEDIERLRDDIANTMVTQDVASAASIVPSGVLRDRLRTIGDTSNSEKYRGIISGGVKGGLLSAGLGAVTSGIARGTQSIPQGAATAVVPGLLGGAFMGHQKVTKRQLLEALSEELGPGANIKRAEVEIGFKEILKELYDAKKRNMLTENDVRQALQDLQVGRGYGLTPPEKLIFERVIYDKTNLPKPMYHMRSSREVSMPPIDIPDPSFNPSTRIPPRNTNTPMWWSYPEKKTQGTVLKPKATLGKSLLWAGGAAAALAALGLAAAHLSKPKDEY